MKIGYALLLGIAALGLSGCHTDMWVQPKEITQGESWYYADKSSARPLVEHTVARGFLREDDRFFTGYENGHLVKDLPLAVNLQLLKRGQERFEIFCTPCHGRLGDGKGIIAQRGFNLRRPVASYHTERLRNAPIGHFYDVMTHGFGVMFSYASRIEPQDRWAIAAYIRVLQLSQHAAQSDLTPGQVAELEKPRERTVAQR
jgi:mono/diheme cytochrome c family protein